jgi:tetratricopeptide (TPR) repeat protein
VLQWLTTSRWPRLLGLSLAVAVTLAVIFFTAGHRYRVRKTFTRAEESWEKGNYQEAIDDYLEIAEEYSDDPLADQAQFQVGNTYYLFLQKDREAIRTFRDLIRRHPASSWSLTAQGLLGEIYEKRLEDYRQAVVEYQRLINLSPSGEASDRAQLAVARCYFSLGDFEQAREEYEIHLERYPDSPDRNKALMGVANSYYVMRACQPAIRYYRTVVEANADSQLRAEAGFGIASCLEESGDLPEALEEFERILKEHPNPGLVRQRMERIGERMEKQKLPVPGPGRKG